MKIYKFGGASVKDANGVKNILKILTELGHKDLTLYTIRHFTDTALQEIEEGKDILVKQLSRETAQFVVS